MTDRDDTPAFPVPPPAINSNTGDPMYASEGMTLRDWFAGQALAGMCAYPNPLRGETKPDASLHARMAYDYADAMMAARKEKLDAPQA